MPEISRFYGIIITMYYNDHTPPHFHVRYGKQKALISIDSLNLLQGKLKSKALELVLEWADQHKSELAKNWELARQYEPLNKIEPLE